MREMAPGARDPLLELIPRPAIRLDGNRVVCAWNGRGVLPWLTGDALGRTLEDVAPAALAEPAAGAIARDEEDSALPSARLVRSAPGSWLLVMDDEGAPRDTEAERAQAEREARLQLAMRDADGIINGTVGIAFDRTEQFRTEAVLSSIAYGAVSKIGDDFFRTAVLGLATFLQNDTAFIAQADGSGILRTIAVARGGAIADNFTFPTAGTASEQVLHGTPCWIEDGVRQQFPDDALLQELEAAGYAGVPIVGSGGAPIGLVAIVDRAPIARDAAAEAALQIYADRAAVELDRAERERSLIDEKEYVENLIDTANVVIIEIDSEGNIRLVNRAFELLTGFSRTDVEGRQLLEVIRDASPKEYVITAGPHELEASITTRTGELLLLQLRANDVRRAGRAVGTILFGLDITEARQNEQRQQRMQEQIANAAREWRHTFDSVLTPILLVDGSGHVVRLNLAARGLIGEHYREIVGARIERLGEGEPFLTAAALLEADPSADETTKTAEATDRSERTWAINVMPFASADRAGSSSIVVLWDISRLVALQESVRISEQMSAMGELVAGVAHEVRNPLFGISAAVDAFEEEFGRTDDFHEYILRLRTDTERLHRLMNDLLQYGRPAELQLAPQPLTPVLERSVHACEPVARQKNVTIDTNVAGNLPNTIIDRDRMVQVLKNVIENAIAFTPAGSTITIESYADAAAQQLVTVVSDSGPGFREDDLRRVFTPFFTRRRGGTGLGLAIVRRIVGDHGGSVTVRTGAQGGAVVEIRLPIEEKGRIHAPQ